MATAKLDALTRAAERWGVATFRQRKNDGSTKRRSVNTTRCLVCGAHVAFGRGVQHTMDHVKKWPPSSA